MKIKNCLFCKKEFETGGCVKYCSRKCSTDDKKVYKTQETNCLSCGKKVITPALSYKVIGKYCSTSCLRAKHYFAYDFFTKKDNPEISYEILGFLFAYAKFNETGAVEIRAEEYLLKNFIEATKTTYEIKECRRPKLGDYHSVSFFNADIKKYLIDIGFSDSSNIHDFPCILPEWHKYFIRGFLNGPNCCVHKKEDHNLVIIISKSYHIIRTISDITGGEMLSKGFDYCCVFKDYERFYCKGLNFNA